MDQKHKNIIEEYRNLLCKNLIISEDFYRVLVTHGVFTEGLIKDVKVGNDQIKEATVGCVNNVPPMQ